MSGPLQLYLVPGFFGFVNFGSLVYFSHVREFLESELSARGCRVQLHRVPVSPTASIATRASELHQFIRNTAPDDGSPLHIVGHSTGGLDARLLVTPDVSLEGDEPVEPIAARVTKIVTIATPHHGTPLASFFTGLLGQRLLRLLSLVTVAILREGAIPMGLVARAASTLARLGLPGSTSAALLDHLESELLGTLPVSERTQVSDFFDSMSHDQALLPQLTPAGLDLFNASTTDRPGTRYGCVITRAPRPSLRRRLDIRLDVLGHATYTFYHWLHNRAVYGDGQQVPVLEPAQRAFLEQAYGRAVRAEDSDGIVPTLSQVRGELLYAAAADHLDVIGHFHDPDHLPPHRDWLNTRASFGRGSFEALWTTVADFLLSPDVV